MFRALLILACLLCATAAPAADGYTSKGLKDVYFGEALFHAYQGEWFEAVSRLDTELGQYRRLDEPALDSLSFHIGQAEFGVGDFELGYRMHLRAGRAISAVIEGKVEEPVRNEAIYRLARLYFQKDQPEAAGQSLERMRGTVPAGIRDEVEFLRGQVLMANGRFAEAAGVLRELQGAKGLEGFTAYNLGIALIKEGKEQDGRQYLDRTGQLVSDNPATQSIKDKANLALGYKLLDENGGEKAKLVLDRVRLSGPFSNKALLGSGWADASRGAFDRALVPWSILAEREVTDPAVQEALLAVPFAYGKLNVHGKAALMYDRALGSFGKEIEKLGASVESVQEGKFLKALAREELKQDSDWVVKLRNLPKAPETYYLLELMASHDFQESLKNYLDLNDLRTKLAVWERDLDAFEDIIQKRREYYQPLLPGIDGAFRELDSQIRLRQEQRTRISKRLNAMLVAPRPDYLATAEERIASEKIAGLEAALAARGGGVPEAIRERIARLKGVLLWKIHTEYDQRLTDAYQHLHDLNEATDRMKRQYEAFVRTRQAARQSFEGYEEGIRTRRAQIARAKEKVKVLMAAQGKLLEAMAVEELSRRRERLEQFQVTARFAVADSYDRASKAQGEASAAKEQAKRNAEKELAEKEGAKEQAGKDAAKKQAEKEVETGAAKDAEKGAVKEQAQKEAPPEQVAPEQIAPEQVQKSRTKEQLSYTQTGKGGGL